MFVSRLDARASTSSILAWAKLVAVASALARARCCQPTVAINPIMTPRTNSTAMAMTTSRMVIPRALFIIISLQFLQ